jgi:hypothetical protein
MGMFETVPHEEAKRILVDYRPGRQRKGPKVVKPAGRSKPAFSSICDEEGDDYVATDII